ncbi:MAG TPA: DUF5916 domain-containing protein [Chitinophagales bacterium]|nr:DUF5916 domain-containing protein [Chitinophagales bacterium]HRK26433.1 DUF5916 domain-containing protein [Chitinophagales bacterium]
MLKLNLPFLFLAFLFGAMAQGVAQVHPKTGLTYELQIKKADNPIKLDGNLQEPDWKNAAVAEQFYQTLPDDLNFAQSKTEVRLTYDDQNLYIAAVCFDDLSGNYIIQSLKRDFSYPVTDAFVVFIDPFGNKTTGFSFAVSPMGVEREGLLENGGVFGVTTSWDNRWFSAVTRQDDRWVVEMAIPFKTLRYDETLPVWNINFSRNDLKRPETSTWSPVPTQFNVASLAFAGKLLWDTPPKKAGGNVSVIPYLRTSASRNYATQSAAKLDNPTGGADAKIAITSSLNLDLTINPDFSQVEVDQQVTNLERFNLFFPERRQFFIENSDLFQFGTSSMRPFFSRRIGLAVPILFGARLSGNLNENWRIGLLNMQTEGIPGSLQSQNYGVATLQRKLFTRSTATAFLINRQSFGNKKPDADDFNRVAGIELRYRSANNRWASDVLYHQSVTQYDSEKFNQNAFQKAGLHANLSYESRHLYAFASAEYAGNYYIADVGFLQDLYQRNDQLRATQPVAYLASLHYAGYKFYPKQLPNMRFWGIETGGKMSYFTDFDRLDRWTFFKLFTYLKDNSIARILVNNYNTQLLFPTNITGRMDSLLQPGLYRYTDAGAEFESAPRNKVYGKFRAYYGNFYNGAKLTLTADATLRIQPLANIALNVAYNRIRFPQGFGNSNLLLLSPRVEFTFTRSLFFTTFLQFNTQTQNFNINNRLQWRFAPMSDVFLVFTDNMNTENFAQKDWGLVLKINYWFTF